MHAWDRIKVHQCFYISLNIYDRKIGKKWNNGVRKNWSRKNMRCLLLWYIFSTIMKNTVKSLHWYHFHKHCILQWTWFSIPYIHICISEIRTCNLCTKIKLKNWLHPESTCNTEENLWREKKWNFDYKLCSIVIEALRTFSFVLRFLLWWTQNQYFTSPKMKFRNIVHFYYLYIPVRELIIPVGYD